MRFPRSLRRPFAAAALLSVSILVPLLRAGAPGQDPFPASLKKAEADLQAGLDAWDPARMAKARDAMLGILMERPEPAAVLALAVGTADLRLASYYLAASNVAEAERFVSEGEAYLDKARKADPKSGLAQALYGFMLGLDVGLHPDQGMTLGMESFGAMAKALSLEPDNPRVHLLNGQYLLYVPEQYGGGADAAVASLEKAAALFESEKGGDPLRPSWGRDQAYAYLGIAWAPKDKAKAKAFFEKALAVNPASGQARAELAKLAKRP